MNEIDRIAKVIARRSGTSRREAERLINERRVRLDNKVVDSPAIKIAYNANLMIDNLPIKPLSKTKLYIFHKPAKTLCSTKDAENRRTIYDLLPEGYEDLKYVGRLDFMSEGLLLLTNDGELARELTLPANQTERVYKVRIFGEFDEKKLQAKLSKPIRISGIAYQINKFSIIERTNNNCWVSINLLEGKNREIRKIFDYFHLKVSRLVRTSYGPYTLGRLKKGEIKEVEIREKKK